MKLHENKTLFRQAVQFTADQMKISAIYVEKDYWVTYALFTIFNNEDLTRISKAIQMAGRIYPGACRNKYFLFVN